MRTKASSGVGPTTRFLAALAGILALALMGKGSDFAAARKLPPAHAPVLVNAPCCAYFPDGQTLAVGRENGMIEIWDLPPRRPCWIEYGLPILFALLMLLGVGHCLRYQ